MGGTYLWPLHSHTKHNSQFNTISDRVHIPFVFFCCYLPSHDEHMVDATRMNIECTFHLYLLYSVMLKKRS